jgi:hypothetical protein
VGGLSEVRVAPIRDNGSRDDDSDDAISGSHDATNGSRDATAVRVAMVGVAARGNSSAVERQPSKLGVAGSNPVSRSRDVREDIRRAHVAQLAERVLGKDEVSGSNPDMGSSFRAAVTASVTGR